MTEKKKPSLIKMLMRMVSIVPTFFSMLSNVTTLVGLEARLAGRNLILVVMLALILGFLIFTTWLCMLVMLFMFCTTFLLWGWLPTMLLITSLNIILLIVVAILLAKKKKNLTFPLLRRQLQLISQLREEA